MKNNVRLTIMALILSGLVSVPAAAEIALPEGDTFTCSYAVNEKFGDPISNSRYVTELAVGPECKSQIAFIMPSGITASSITKATLNIFVDSVLMPGSLTVSKILPSALSSKWDELTLTSMSYESSYTIAPAPMLSAIDISNRNSSWYSLDITGLVKSWSPKKTGGVAPLNLGIEISSTNGIAVAYLHSKENSHNAFIDITSNKYPK